MQRATFVSAAFFFWVEILGAFATLRNVAMRIFYWKKDAS